MKRDLEKELQDGSINEPDIVSLQGKPNVGITDNLKPEDIDPVASSN